MLFVLVLMFYNANLNANIKAFNFMQNHCNYTSHTAFRIKTALSIWPEKNTQARLWNVGRRQRFPQARRDLGKDWASSPAWFHLRLQRICILQMFEVNCSITVNHLSLVNRNIKVPNQKNVLKKNIYLIKKQNLTLLLVILCKHLLNNNKCQHRTVAWL